MWALLQEVKHYLLVAAIDFGTTFSSWAYQFKHDYDRDPSKVFSKRWTSNAQFVTKAPTTVLIHPDRETFHSFGVDAEDKFAELASENKHESWYYFRHFKMKLFQAEKLNLEISIAAHNGEELSALLIFSLAIERLKTDLMEGVNKQLTSGSDVLWVLTVPAIWNDGAKHFLRQAAIKAVINDENLLIALEPEAASIYCRHVSLDTCSGVKGTTIETFASGQKYLLLDAGGGTIDINVHEVIENNELRELHKPTGSSWGGTTVDNAFQKFLTELFGRSVMGAFQSNYLDEWLTLSRHFETDKTNVSHKRDKPSLFPLPVDFEQRCKSDTGRGVKELIANSLFVENLSLARGNRLKISTSVMRSFYNESIRNIIAQLETILKDKRVEGCRTILMVGGYSECDLLQEEIKLKFPHMDVITPSEASLAVVKGAVMYGRNPQVIVSRMCKYTYGIEVNSQFDRAIYPEKRKFVDATGRTRVDCVFRKLVEVGQDVSPCHMYKRDKIGKPPGPERSGYVRLVASTKKDPVFTDEDDSFVVGTFHFNWKDRHGKISPFVTPVLLFGGTEIEMRVVFETTGEEKKAIFRLPD